jgi:hypothetical protein
MQANSRLRAICTENKERHDASPDPAEAHRLLEAFWQITDAKVRARLMREAEAAAARGR